MNLWLLLNHIILSQTCSKLQNDSSEDSEEYNSLEKIHLLRLRGTQIKVRLQVSCKRHHINTAWLPSKVLLRLFLQVSKNFGGWNFSECLVAWSRQRKSFLGELLRLKQAQYLIINNVKGNTSYCRILRTNINFSRDKPSNKKKFCAFWALFSSWI